MRLVIALATLLIAASRLGVVAGQAAVSDPKGDFIFCETGAAAQGPGIADIVGAAAALKDDTLRWTLEMAEPLPEAPPPGTGIRITFGVIDPRQPRQLTGYNREIDFQIANAYSVTITTLSDEGSKALGGELAIDGSTVTITSPAKDWDVASPEDARGFGWTVASSAFVNAIAVCDRLTEELPVYEVEGVAPGPGPTAPPPTSLSPVATASPGADGASGDDGFPLWVLIPVIVGGVALAGGAVWGIARLRRR